MGLTIHYQLVSAAVSITDVRRVLEQLRQRARDLPFQTVGEILELAGDRCNFEKCAKDDPHRWLLIQAGEYLEHTDKNGDTYSINVPPTHLIAFGTQPGEGCEPANFGMCRFPTTVMFRGQRIRTKLSGWRWGSFCKTQYASGLGTENFLRCHLSVIRLLDYAKELGILAGVSDEGDYWEKRDVVALIRCVGEWNQLIAAFAGRLKDQLGDGVVAPITQFPNFEILEAKGRDAELRRDGGPNHGSATA